MLQSFGEIVRHDKHLLALLKIGDRRSSAVENVHIKVVDIGDICVKILAIETKNPKCYSRRTAWTITGLLVLNLTNHYTIQVEILFAECQRFKQNFTRQSFIFNSGPAAKRKISTKEAAKQPRGGKKRRSANNNDNDDDAEQNDHTTFNRERFWEVPLTLEANINATVDACLVPAEQITLRERIFDEPSQIDVTYEEQLFNNGFGDDGQRFPFDDDEPMPSLNLAVDENMNDIMDIPEISDILNAPGSQMMHSAHVHTPQQSKEPSTQHSTHAESVNENATNLLGNSSLSSLPTSVVAQNKKSTAKRRRATLLVDEETIISNRIMKERTSNAFIGCKNRKKLRMRMSNQFNQQKTNDLFTESAIKGLLIGRQFARGGKTRPMPVDWTIIDGMFDSIDPADNGDSEASEILQTEHSGQFNRTRNQSRNMSFNEIASFDGSLMPPPPPPFTSTPQRPRRFDRSSRSVSRAASPSNVSNLFTPPLAFQNPAQSPNFPSQAVPPPIEYGDADDDDDGISVCINQNNDDQQSGVQSGSSFQPVNGEASTTIATDEEIEESEGDPVENTDLKTALGENSIEYTIITKLIRLWQKDTHPVQVEHLLKKGCNRIQAAKTFASLLILKKKNLIQMDNANDGKITHISAGSKMTLPV